ncbi:MAG: chorismate-binding protein, partial [Deltaproteobacteria bacterium]|nr:chorismate-binding protein [Deltaproteobacteria bacterium]
DRITTRPIKGTLRRGLDPKHLLASEKDRAELLMITDLERNDLGKICETGTVVADPLFGVESFAQVHHLVATVSGTLKKGMAATSVFGALFPGGSVTGAPKIRALQIIKELESEPRSVYTGALGFISDGRAQFNLPIRTMTKVGEDVFFHAGCGIVADSEPSGEFDEMMAKASGMIKALGL